MLSKTEIASIDATFSAVKKVWLQRRRAGHTICETLTDAMSLKKEAAREWLVEEQGIEFDGNGLDELAKPAPFVAAATRGAPARGLKRKA